MIYLAWLFLNITEFKEICIQIIDPSPSFDFCPFWCTFKFSHIIYCYFCDCKLGLKYLLNALVFHKFLLLSEYLCPPASPPPPSSHVWILTSDMVVLGAGPLWGDKVMMGELLGMGSVPLFQDAPQGSLLFLPCEDTVWSWHLQPWGFHQNPTTLAPGLNFWLAELWKISVVYKLPSEILLQQLDWTPGLRQFPLTHSLLVFVRTENKV